jgi:hypothetical protein
MAENEAADFVQADDLRRVGTTTIYYEPYVSQVPGIIFGVQACVCTIWWFIIMFVYVKNTSTDADLMTLGNTRAVPLSWWWERISEYGGKSTFLGLSLMFSFLFYGVVSIPELVAWIMYMFNDMDFARWWFPNVGYWGTIIFYGMPTVFAFVQVARESTLIFPGSWTLFQLISSLLIWITVMLIHIFYIDAFILEIDSQYIPSCSCTWPVVKDEPDDQKESTVNAWKVAKKQRAE